MSFALHQNRAALDETVSENDELKHKVQELQSQVEAEAERSDDYRWASSHCSRVNRRGGRELIEMICMSWLASDEKGARAASGQPSEDP